MHRKLIDRSATASTLALYTVLVFGCGGRAESQGERSALASSDESDAGSGGARGPQPSSNDDQGAQDCEPLTCVDVPVTCGTPPDGCGGELACGSCGDAIAVQPEAAVPTVGLAPAMTAPGVASVPPAPAPAVTRELEPAADMDAGSPQVEDPQPEPACEPETCQSLELQCGSVADDGCGQLLDCGACPPPNCTAGELLSVVADATSSRGMGFTGTDDQYSSLYYVPCETVADCEVACAEVGGNEAMCAASLCTDNFEGGKDCLPATAWRSVADAIDESRSIIDAAEQSMVNQEYNDFLAVEGFGFEIPSDALILGITVEFLRAAGREQEISDHEVSLLRDGQRVGEARGYPGETWGTEFVWVSYGGEADLWGESWTPQVVNSAGFGSAISAQYHEQAGNGRAYVDHARITIHYGSGCEEGE